MTTQTLAILSAMLSDPHGEWYGLQLAKTVGLKSGTVYPALARLEQAGWLSSCWEGVDPVHEQRPKRRLYRLTGKGAAAAPRAVDEHLTRLGVAGRSQAPRARPGVVTS